MSGTAHIYDAELNPTKDELARRFAGFDEVVGSWRLVDPDDVVGIEILVGHDFYGRVLQLPVTYRPIEAALDEGVTFTEMDHNILGRRAVTMATADPVAVREMIRTIIASDTSADFSLGSPVLTAHGSGCVADDPISEVSEVELREYTRQRASGVALVDGAHRNFVLRIAAQPGPARPSSTGYQTPKLRLTTTAPELFGDAEVVLADLYWMG